MEINIFIFDGVFQIELLFTCNYISDKDKKLQMKYSTFWKVRKLSKLSDYIKNNQFSIKMTSAFGSRLQSRSQMYLLDLRPKSFGRSALSKDFTTIPLAWDKCVHRRKNEEKTRICFLGKVRRTYIIDFSSTSDPIAALGIFLRKCN